MVAKLVVALSFMLVLFTVTDASAEKTRTFGSTTTTTTTQTTPPTNNIVVPAPEPGSLYGLASGVLLLGGAAWLVRRK